MRPRIKIINHRTKDRYDDEKTFTVTVKGDDGSTRKLLECIQKTVAVGHSFSVVVDPGDREYTQSFGFDGDGACRIVDISK
jgi:hypothetical protein